MRRLPTPFLLTPLLVLLWSPTAAPRASSDPVADLTLTQAADSFVVRVVYPGQDWAFVADLPGFTVEMDGMMDAERRYLSATNPTTEVNFSVALEYVPQEGGAAHCRAHLQAETKVKGRDKVKLTQSGDEVRLAFVVELEENRFRITNHYACLPRGDFSVVLHFSKVNLEKGEEGLFAAVRETVRFESLAVSAAETDEGAEENAPNYEIGMKAYERGDYRTAYNHFAPLAEQGVRDAQFSLAVLYANGHVVPQNFAEAMKWYRKAAEQGHLLSIFRVGVMHEHGEGVPKDDAEAAEWYRRAAGAGFGPAQSSLGTLYLEGRGVPKDEAEAMRWFRAAAEQGLASAQANLGWGYFYGKGVPQDDNEAAKWNRLAAEQGNARAQYRLGHLYIVGKGVPQDYEQAAYWLTKSAERGNSSAQGLLGALYAEGRGVKKDNVIAYMWVTLYLAGGHPTADELRQKLAKRMKSKDIDRAEQLARDWKPKPESPR